MKRVILAEIGMVLLLAALMTAFLWKKEAKDVPLSQIETAFTSTQDLTGMEKVGDMRLKRAFGLNAADYEEYLYYAPDNTMGVEELLIVKMKTEDQEDTILEAIDSRIAAQKVSFDGYGTDQTDLLNHAEIYTNGNYVCLLISREQSDWLQVIRSQVEG